MNSRRPVAACCHCLHGAACGLATVVAAAQLVAKNGDDRPDLDLVAALDADFSDRPICRGRNRHRRLVRFDFNDRIPGADRLAGLHGHIDDRRVDDAFTEFGQTKFHTSGD